MNKILFIKVPEVIKNGKVILKEFDFSFPTHSIIAIVGPNGAGKTTLLRMLLEPGLQAGLVFRLHNRSLESINRNTFSTCVSFLGSSDFSQPLVSVIEFIKSSAYTRTLESERIHKELEYWGLKAISDQRVSELSLGQFQRLLLIVTFLHDAELFLLDEPERHLDPQGRKLLLEKMKLLKENGKTVLFATHDIDLAVTVAQYFVGINANGVKEFSSDNEMLIKAKFLDSLFDTQFTYHTVDGTMRILN